MFDHGLLSLAGPSVFILFLSINSGGHIYATFGLDKRFGRNVNAEISLLN